MCSLDYLHVAAVGYDNLGLIVVGVPQQGADDPYTFSAEVDLGRCWPAAPPIAVDYCGEVVVVGVMRVQERRIAGLVEVCVDNVVLDAGILV